MHIGKKRFEIQVFFWKPLLSFFCCVAGLDDIGKDKLSKHFSSPLRIQCSVQSEKVVVISQGDVGRRGGTYFFLGGKENYLDESARKEHLDNLFDDRQHPSMVHTDSALQKISNSKNLDVQGEKSYFLTVGRGKKN